MKQRHPYRFLLFTLTLLAASTVSAQAEVPTCETLVSSLDSVFSEAQSYEVATAIIQGEEREVAWERVRAQRGADGNWTAETLERRGLPRPDNAGGDSPGQGFDQLGLTCDTHDLSTIGTRRATLELPAENPDEGLRAWTMEFQRDGDRWIPNVITGRFQTRVAFVPITGRIEATFSSWTF